LLRISKSCKRTDSDEFLKKSADPDSVSDSGWKYYKHVFTDVWFGIRTSNGHKWGEWIPLADNKHCYVVVVYLWVSENGVSAILTGFWWYKFEKWGKKNFEHTFQNPSFSAAKNPRIWTRTNGGEVCGFGCELGIRNNTRNNILLQSLHWPKPMHNVPTDKINASIRIHICIRLILKVKIHSLRRMQISTSLATSLEIRLVIWKFISYLYQTASLVFVMSVSMHWCCETIVIWILSGCRYHYRTKQHKCRPLTYGGAYWYHLSF